MSHRKLLRQMLGTEMRFMMYRTTLRRTRALYSGCSTVCAQRQPALPSTSTAAPLHVASVSLAFPLSPSAVQTRCYSSPAQKSSSIERIKVVLKEYGGVAVVFHTVMSLTSLGTCYLIVSSGVDVGKVLEYFNVQSSAASKGASTFAVSYVLHKMLLPLRAGITVAAVPLIVRWLRTRGWVKGVVKQVQTK